MTSDGIHCSHEGLNGCKSLEEYKAKFTSDSGDSNTGLACFPFEDIFEEFKIVVIDSDIKESVEFTRRNFDADITNEMTSMKKALDSINCLHIKFDEINDNLKTIWEYLTDKPFDSKRAEMLKGFNVQVMNIHDFDEDAFVQLMTNTNVNFT